MRNMTLILAVLMSAFLFMGATVIAGEKHAARKGGEYGIERAGGEDSHEGGVS